MLKDELNSNLKTAMLAGDKEVVEVIKGLKSAIMYAEVAKGKKEDGFSDDEILLVFQKEAKKRQDASDMFLKGGNNKKATEELNEKKIIEQYLPKQKTDKEIDKTIEETIKELGITEVSMRDMGRIIGKVKIIAGPNADSSTVARLVKNRISK